MLTQAEITDVLGRTEMFGGLDATGLSALAGAAVEQGYPKGATVFVQDEPGDRMFVVARGGVRVVRRSAGGDSLELLRLRQHSTFGELALLDGGPRSATVETTQASTLLSLSRDVVMALLQQFPALVPDVLRLLAGSVREAARRESDLVFLDLKGRLARRLLELDAASADPHPLARANRVTQTELAQMVGASRQRVHAALHALEHAGHIELHETGITVRSREGLAREISV